MPLPAVLAHRRLDVGENFARPGLPVDAGKHRERLLVVAVNGQETRRFGDQQDQEGKESGGHRLGNEHQAPAHRIRPFGHRGIVGMAADDEEIHEIHHQLAENDGKLVPRHQAAAFAGRSDLRDVHGADGRSQADTDAAEDAVAVEGEQQPLRGDALLEEQELRAEGAEGAEQEEDAGHEQGLLAAQAPGEAARNEGADDAADQRAGGREPMQHVAVVEVGCALEEGLEAFFCAGNNGRIIAEKQSADHRHEDDRDQVQRAAMLSVSGHNREE